jgi:hypothetical protein
MTVSEYVTRFT